MSKKKKNYYADLVGKKHGKKNKKDLNKAMKKAKTVQPTLTKKEAKANAKEIGKPLKIDKEFLKRRYSCNHAKDVISAEEYRTTYPGKADAYTPMLQTMIDTFGEENVAICDRCFEVVVNRDQISSDQVKEALAILYGACGVAVSNVRLKKDEVKSVNKLKDAIEEFTPVLKLLNKIEEKGSANASDDAVNLNDVGMEIN